MTPASLAAPAKVNLQLGVTGRRDDGYHLIDSLAVFAGLADKVTLATADEPRLSVIGPFAAPLADKPGLEANSVGKAIEAFHDETGKAGPYDITLEKNIPVAAGLGGGSADAAATLVLLNRLHGEPLDSAALDRVGLAVGADVPVCLRCHGEGTAGWRMRGTGETLDRVALPEGLGVVLVNDGHAVATASVFGAFGSGKPGEAALGDLPDPCGMDALRERLGLGNDLLPAAIETCPGIAETLEAVGGASGLEGYVASGMTGSGGACFSLFESRAAAEAAKAPIGDGRRWCWAGGLFDRSQQQP